MRVLWMIDGLGPGGAENMMPPLLRQLNEKGIESRVCVLQVRKGNPIADEIRKLGIQVDVVQMANLRDFGSLPGLLKYVREYRPDLIHTQLEASDIFGTLISKILHIPSVTTLHTLDVKPKLKRSYWRNLIRRKILSSFSTRIVTVSDITRKHYTDLGIRKNKMITLYNGINLDRFGYFRKNRANKASIFGIPADSMVVTTVAVLREAKGIQYMLNALPLILSRLPNLYYVIAGDGDYRGSLENIARSRGLERHVKFLGHRSDIPEILSATDLFVFPTLTDALPTVLFEAMAVGVPIVSAGVGGVPEILTHDLTGLLVPPADAEALAEACLRVLTDGNLACRFSASAVETVEDRFDVRKQAGNLFNLYQQLVPDHAS